MTMKLNLTQKTIAIAGLVSAICSGTSYAQSADALIDKLVQKGILTVKEGNELREEADKGFNQAYSVKSGMPDWVNALKINGDFRGRFEGFYSENDNFAERNRFRYRARLGVTATLFDNLEVGMRLTSSETAGGFTEGDPISNNTSFSNNGSKKSVFFDLAYAKWSPLHSGNLSGSITVGKMETPFVVSDMVFDQDYTPEGIALQTAYAFSGKHTLKGNLAGYALDELGASPDDPAMLGAQARLDSAWSKKVSTSAGVSGFWIKSEESLTSANVPNINVGNTRVPVVPPSTAGGYPAYNFNPVVADASLTYTLDKAPWYKGAFPIKVGGEYMNNPAAPSSADNDAWNAGITFGKAGKKGTWELAYSYKWLGANSWYEELTDSDFGAYYAATPPNSSRTGAGYYAGTNVKGHIVKASYSPYDPLTLSVKWFLTELINDYGVAGSSQMNRLQVDASLKF
jgi:hypothetical protein